MKRHSEFLSYTVPSTGFTYPSIRTFYRPHSQTEKLPSEPSALPLLVFVHGLGGSVAQFAPLLTSLVNVGPCLSIDLPGCGLSKFEPRSWEAYTTDALARLLGVAIEKYRDENKNQGVVMIGHSMGASIAALLASSSSPYSSLVSHHILALVAICPKATPPSEKSTSLTRKLLAIPDALFNVWRAWNRRGGTESASVASFVGRKADVETKRLQLHFNAQSRTPVFRRMARGALPNYSNGHPIGGLPGKDIWAGLEIAVHLIAGAADAITPATELEQIASFMGKRLSGPDHSANTVPVAAASARLDSVTEGQLRTAITFRDGIIDPEDKTSRARQGIDSYAHPRQRLLKSNILPEPAAHALLYAPTTFRVVAGLIENFLAERVDKRLSLSWQLQHLATEGKWDVKNLEKWQRTAPVSEPIGNTFRAIKTMREVDHVHSPAFFVENWKGRIHTVVDISSGDPVYAPEGLDAGDIKYHKFPTVSKQPPTNEEVRGFVALIDQITATVGRKEGLIGVHCHYGFNRTGYFIVCYLVERRGYRLQDAIEEFGKQRSPGIRHEHFIDELHVRYAVGLQRAPTA